jgi:hypothetical protein
MADKITVHEMTPKELDERIQEIMKQEFNRMCVELQRSFGEDDLISTGSACRLLGVSSKYFKILIDRGEFTVYFHLKERRFNRGEILAYREQYVIKKRN